MSIGDRLMQAIYDKGWSSSELSRRAGVPQPTVHRIGGGASRSPRHETVAKLAKALGVSEEWLWTGRDTSHVDTRDLMSDISLWDDKTPLDDDEVSVPFLREVELAAGSGRFGIEESTTASLRFGKRSLRHNGVQAEHARCVIVRGNSMLPVLRDGATVAVNTAKTSISEIVDGDLYAINQNGQLRVKQVYRLPSGLRFRSFNRDEHPDEEYSFRQIQDEQIAILGHVFWWGMYAR